MSTTSLGHSGTFFFNSHFVFILLTKLFKYYFNLLTRTTTERHPPLACEPLARRVDCRMDDGTKQWEGQGNKTTGGKGNKTMGGKGNETTGGKGSGKEAQETSSTSLGL